MHETTSMEYLSELRYFRQWTSTPHMSAELPSKSSSKIKRHTVPSKLPNVIPV